MGFRKFFEYKIFFELTRLEMQYKVHWIFDATKVKASQINSNWSVHYTGPKNFKLYFCYEISKCLHNK